MFSSKRDLTVPQAPQSIRLLILGGTGFIGPHMVRYALDRGHTVTIFNRGRTNPHLFPEVEKLVGDRDGDLRSLEGREWDAVIDNSGYVPRHVRDSAQLLSNASRHYLFTSTAGVYSYWYNEDGTFPAAANRWPTGGTDEDAPTAPLPEPGSEEVGKYYGSLKALCEEEVLTAFPGRSTITRPGLIVGPLDNTDRFTYFPVRIDRGGEVLALGDPTDPVQYIDARDLAGWSVRMVEARESGIYNALGPLWRFTMAEMLYGIRAVTSAAVRFTWVDAQFLADQGVGPFDLAPWVSQISNLSGAAHFRRERAFAKGLTFRPFAETVRDTLDWFKSLPEERQASPRGGLPAEREAEILSAWHAR